MWLSGRCLLTLSSRALAPSGWLNRLANFAQKLFRGVGFFLRPSDPGSGPGSDQRCAVWVHSNTRPSEVRARRRLGSGRGSGSWRTWWKRRKRAQPIRARCALRAHCSHRHCLRIQPRPWPSAKSDTKELSNVTMQLSVSQYSYLVRPRRILG